MTTVVELTKKARALELTGYSGLRKPALEKMIDDELRRRENIKLAEIRNAEGSAPTLPALEPFIPTQPFDIEPAPFIVEPIKGLGINNRQRITNYLKRKPGAKHLTHAEARRVRKAWTAGDNSIPGALIYATSDITFFL